MEHYTTMAKDLRARAQRLLRAADALGEIDHEKLPVVVKRRLSVAARKRIATAQRLRWAKVRKEQAQTSKR